MHNEPQSEQAPPWQPSQDELTRYQSREAAAVLPLPGPLADAFASSGRELVLRTVNGPRTFTLRPLTLQDFILLQRLSSPILKVAALMGRQNLPPEEIERALSVPMEGETPEDAQARLTLGSVETFLLFTQPYEASIALLSGTPDLSGSETNRPAPAGSAAATPANGRQNFRAAAEALARTLPFPALADIQFAVGQHFATSFATAVNYEPDNGDGNFTSPPANPTASAGGSNSSAP